MRHSCSRESILEALLQEKDEVNIVSNTAVHFQCGCSRERFARGLLLVGHKDTLSLMDEGPDARLTLNCNFCNEHYHFSRSEVNAIFEA